MKTEYKTTITLTPAELATIIRKALEVPEASEVNFKITEMSDFADRFLSHEFTSVDIVVRK